MQRSRKELSLQFLIDDEFVQINCSRVAFNCNPTDFSYLFFSSPLCKKNKLWIYEIIFLRWNPLFPCAHSYLHHGCHEYFSSVLDNIFSSIIYTFSAISSKKMCCCLYFFSLSNMYAHLFAIESTFNIYWVNWILFLLHESEFGIINGHQECLDAM